MMTGLISVGVSGPALRLRGAGCVGVALLGLVVAGACGQEPAPGVESRFGERQLQQMLEDRPSMASALPSDHPIREWVESRFDGKTLGFRVYWVDGDPTGGFSDYAAPYQGVPAFIRVSDDPQLTPVDRWALAVYELHNVGYAEQMNALAQKAYTRELSGEQYATEAVRAEFKASLATAQFFKTHPLPEASDRPAHFYRSLCAWRGTFEEYREACRLNAMPLGNYDHFLGWYKSLPAPADDAAAEAPNE